MGKRRDVKRVFIQLTRISYVKEYVAGCRTRIHVHFGPKLRDLSPDANFQLVLNISPAPIVTPFFSQTTCRLTTIITPPQNMLTTQQSEENKIKRTSIANIRTPLATYAVLRRRLLIMAGTIASDSEWYDLAENQMFPEAQSNYNFEPKSIEINLSKTKQQVTLSIVELDGNRVCSRVVDVKDKPATQLVMSLTCFIPYLCFTCSSLFVKRMLAFHYGINR